MAWALAYEKAHNLKKFWEQYIDKVLPDGMNIYQEWVYKRESIMAGVAFEASDQTCIDGLGPAAERQMSVHGFWTGPEFLPGCYVREYEGGRCPEPTSTTLILPPLIQRPSMPTSMVELSSCSPRCPIIDHVMT